METDNQITQEFPAAAVTEPAAAGPNVVPEPAKAPEAAETASSTNPQSEVSMAAKDKPAADAPVEPILIGPPIPKQPGFFSSGPDDGPHLAVTTTFRPTAPDHDKLFVKVAENKWQQTEGF
jgi:hypothetical protein